VSKLLFVSIDAGLVALVESEIDPEILAAVAIGTLDVFKGKLQLGFDGKWHPIPAMSAQDFLSQLPSPVMSRLPHEEHNGKSALHHRARAVDH
jgi:hypothetical protein